MQNSILNLMNYQNQLLMTTEKYEIPNYMYIIDLLLTGIPEYKTKIESSEFYDRFLKRTFSRPIDYQISSLPLMTLENVVGQKLQDLKFFQFLIDNNIIKNLFVLLSVLTGQNHRNITFSPQMITKNDMIQLPEFVSTSNYYPKGIGFSTDDSQSVWNVELTKWKVKTERKHVILVLKILDCLFKEVESTDSVEIQEAMTEIYLNSCLIHTIIESLKNNSSKINYFFLKILFFVDQYALNEGIKKISF
jgi:hypothetical protein